MLQNQQNIFIALRNTATNRGMCLPTVQEVNMFLLGWAMLYLQTGGGGITAFCHGLLIAIKRGGNQDSAADGSDHHWTIQLPDIFVNYYRLCFEQFVIDKDNLQND